ncbi:MAG: DUF2177 family protein [Methylacidiphilales bacterium]|nr:DUF2177 family protein [Candidatus Methylacidiphilales bacterium]
MIVRNGCPALPLRFDRQDEGEGGVTLKQAIGLYGCTLGVMLALDIMWLGVIARDFYQAQIGPLLLDRPALLPAAAFYLLYGAGIVIFAVSPAVGDGAPTTALLYGALFGLIAYATYDLTNLATLRGFPVAFAVVDIAWGSAVTAVSAWSGYVLARYLGVVG